MIEPDYLKLDIKLLKGNEGRLYERIDVYYEYALARTFEMRIDYG